MAVQTSIILESLAPKKAPSEGINVMSLSDENRERIREEEMVRLEVRAAMKRRQSPRLMLLAVLWGAVLTALALIVPQVHH
jgi:hypothetical protein